MRPAADAPGGEARGAAAHAQRPAASLRVQVAHAGPTAPRERRTLISPPSQPIIQAGFMGRCDDATIPPRPTLTALMWSSFSMCFPVESLTFPFIHSFLWKTGTMVVHLSPRAQDALIPCFVGRDWTGVPLNGRTPSATLRSCVLGTCYAMLSCARLHRRGIQLKPSGALLPD